MRMTSNQKDAKMSQLLKIPKKDFIDFIVEAKVKTYAGNGKKIKGKDTSRHYSYEKPPFKYHDTYYGNLVDCGREIVFLENKPVWGMCYHGGAIEDFRRESAEIFSFLRNALSLTSSKAPMRGPPTYSEGKYEYFNRCSGDILDFAGEEEIADSSLNKRVYVKHYCGGAIEDRSYKVVFLG